MNETPNIMMLLERQLAAPAEWQLHRALRRPEVEGLPYQERIYATLPRLL